MTWRQLVEILKGKGISIVVIIVLALANIAMAVYSLTIQQPSLQRLQEEWSSRRNLVAGGGGDLSAIYRRGKTDLELLHERIPPKRDFTRQMMEIFELASNNGLMVKGVSYKPDQIREPNLVVYGVSMTLEGKYAGVKSFISDLQCHGGLLAIDSVSLSSGSMKEEVVSLRMQLSTYFRPEGK